jgi:hypothetical protein
LERDPAAPAWSGRFEADSGQLLLRREVGDFGVDLPRPHLARHLRERRNGALGEMSIPLSPSCLLAIGKVERVHDIATLPAIVWGRVALWQRR